MEDELNRFREDWRESLQQVRLPDDLAQIEAKTLATIAAGSSFSNEPIHEATQDLTEEREAVLPHATQEEELSALQLYGKGIERERQGALKDALNYYRKAYKLDSGVDRLVREAYKAGLATEPEAAPNTSLEESDYAVFVQTRPDFDHKRQGASDGMGDILSLMARLQMPIEGEPNRASISKLPDELILSIIRSCILTEPTAFTSISTTCQKFCLIAQERAIWKDLCFATYLEQVYEDAGFEVSLSSDASWQARMDREVEAYGSDWQRMFIERPRIQFKGIYIATCHYTRPGQRDASEYGIVHLVTYFRYIRFYPDGCCLCLLTPTEPAEVVHQIHKVSKLKGLQRGRWQLNDAGEIYIETNGPASYLFFMELKIKSTSRGRHNKLAWKNFKGVNPHSGEVTEFNLRHDKSYFYSRVKSYTHE